MSCNAIRFRVRRHTCPCGRPAVYLSRARRRFRARPDHALCLRCHRGLLASAIAQGLSARAVSDSRRRVPGSGGERHGRHGEPPSFQPVATSVQMRCAAKPRCLRVVSPASEAEREGGGL